MKWKLSLLAGLLAVSGIAVAQATPSFSDLDANGDGMLERTEVEQDAEIGASFDDIDGNGDGMVDEAEFSRWQQTQGAEDSAEMGDTTGTGQETEGTDTLGGEESSVE